MIARNGKLFLLAITALACAHCASVPAPESTASVEPDGDSYVVIGVKPDNVRLTISDGSIKDGLFVVHAPKILPDYGPADHGFIVFKAPKGTTLGLIGAQVLNGLTDFTGPRFEACETPVFEVPAGKVLYLTSVAFGVSQEASFRAGGQIVPSFYSKFQDALVYMIQHYPNLANRLEQARFQWLKTDTGYC